MTDIKYKHLLGREFVHGITDCYSLARDLFKDNNIVELTNYARPSDWWIKDYDLYVENFSKEGFVVMDDLNPRDFRPMDVFLIAIPDPRCRDKIRTNHCAIYLGDGKIIHHRLGQLSAVTQYRGPLRNWTTHVLRHKSLLKTNQNTKEENLNLMDYILPHKREMLEKALKNNEK